MDTVYIPPSSAPIAQIEGIRKTRSRVFAERTKATTPARIKTIMIDVILYASVSDIAATASHGMLMATHSIVFRLVSWFSMR